MLLRFLRTRSASTCRHRKNTRRRHRLEFESLERRAVFAAGEMDPSFGIAGQARAEFNDSASWGSMALASAIQSDGKILAAGEGGLVRYTADGTLDASFGDSGRVAFPHYARAMTVQSDGKVLVAGGTAKFNSTDMIVARYLESGLLDTTFDGDGIASIDFGGPGEWATSILVEPSGRIVVAGGAGTGVAVARMLNTGAVDTGFATGGKLSRQFTISDTAYALTQQANGRILVAGTSQLSTQFGNINSDMFVLSLNTNGTIDSSFSGDGIAFVDFLSARVSRDQGRGVAVQADGRILVTGSVYGNFSDYAGLARLNVNGSLDETFGDQGRVRYPLSREVPTGDVLVQSDGRVLMTTHQGIARFQSNGTLDTSFDGDGFLPVSGTIYTGKLQADGSVVVGGNFLQRFGVRRYLSSGAVDLGFAGGGVATTLMGPSNDLANHSVLQADGKIVIVGSSQGGFAVARYLSTGALDTTFSSDGLGVYKFGSDSFEAEATSVAMQRNGQIVVAGWIQERTLGSNSARFAVVRLNSDGSLDTNFSEDGLQTTDLGGASQVQSVVVQNDGKIVVGGRSLGNFATLVRYNTDGSLDRSFSGDGIASMASEGSAISRIVLQPDGRILAAGFQNTPAGRSSRYSTILMMARFNANGSLDSTFGTKGKMVALSTSQRNADDIVLLPDGRFVVVGDASVFTNGSETIHIAVSRFHANGNVDDTFGTRVLPQTEKSTSGDFFIDPIRSWGSSIMRQADGKLVVSGYGDNSLIVVRLRDDGSLDTSFAGDGSFALGSTSDRLRATHVLQQASGELIVTGYARSSTRDSFEHDFLAVRLQYQPVGSSAMSVSLNSSGQIAITDLWSRNDVLQFTRLADSIVVQDMTGDPFATFRVQNLPGVTGDGTQQISIPFSLLQATGQPLIVNGLSGDDQILLLNDQFELPPSGMQFRGGAGEDTVSLVNHNIPVSWVMASATSGSARPLNRVPLSFTGVEQLVGGQQTDSFRLLFQRGSALIKIDGGGGTQDLIEFRGDANVSFTYAFTRGQRLIAENAGRQEYAFRGIERATISGGASANIIDARELIFPVTIYGSGGDDELFGSNSAPSTIFGDDGNDRIFGSRSPDTLRGGRGNDVIYGNDGNDLIYGEDGHDILVGGYGADMLYGGDGDDLLMGAYSPYFVGGSDRAAREAIMAVWSSTETYTAKISQLKTGVGVDNAIRLNFGHTFFDDFAVDTFFGNAGTDLFLLNVFTELNLPLGGLRDKSLGEVDTY